MFSMKPPPPLSPVSASSGYEPDRSAMEKKETPCQTKCKHEVGWRRIVRNFTPAWFSVNMSTGIVGALLLNLPYTASWVKYIAYAFLTGNIFLFILFTAVSVLRYALYPEIWWAMISHPGQSLFLGCFPMALASIINLIILCCKQWGSGIIYLAWALWWLDAALSVATAISMPFIVMHRHKPGLSSTTAALLLPIVPTVVAAATGGVVAEAILNHQHALTTLVVSYVLWGIGQCLSACVLAMYFHRLTVHSLPPKEVIVSVFLPVGPLGQGGFGIQQLGEVAVKLLSRTRVFEAAGVDATHGAEILYVLGVFFGLVMWGFALVWVCFAIISLVSVRNFPFNMGWWGFVFPLGVWGMCTVKLAQNFDSVFFKVFAMIIAFSVFGLWSLVACRTTFKAIKGDIFVAPCLNSLKTMQQSAPVACDGRV